MFRKGLLKTYEGLFEEESVNEDEEAEESINEEEDGDDSTNDNYGFVNIIFDLCNDDLTKIDLVTKRNIIEVLNFLSYKKMKYEKEKERQKHAQKL